MAPEAVKLVDCPLQRVAGFAVNVITGKALTVMVEVAIPAQVPALPTTV